MDDFKEIIEGRAKSFDEALTQRRSQVFSASKQIRQIAPMNSHEPSQLRPRPVAASELHLNSAAPKTNFYGIHPIFLKVTFHSVRA
jgi:hypothetical protein